MRDTLPDLNLPDIPGVIVMSPAFPRRAGPVESNRLPDVVPRFAFPDVTVTLPLALVAGALKKLPPSVDCTITLPLASLVLGSTVNL